MKLYCIKVRRKGTWRMARDTQNRPLLWDDMRAAWASTPSLFDDGITAISVEEYPSM